MNVLLIDDHPLFGLGFVQALTHGRADADVRTVLTLDQGLELAGRWAALDAVLIDCRLGGDDGVDGLRRFGARYPLVARILISGEMDRALVARARAAGAAACLGKSISMFELHAALDAVYRGASSSRPGRPRSLRQMVQARRRASSTSWRSSLRAGRTSRSRSSWGSPSARSSCMSLHC